MSLDQHEYEHQEAPARRMESEARFRNPADSIPMSAWTSGIDARCDYMNRTCFETEQSQFAGYLESGTDNTDRKAAEEAMAMLGQVMEHVWDAIIITDTRGGITYMNRAFQTLTGVHPPVASGWSVGDLIERETLRKAL